MKEFVLACALLTSPVETPENVTREQFTSLKAAIQETAIEWEIMDEREKSYMLANYQEFQTDLDILRKRYEDLRDAPKLNEGKRFPVKDAASLLAKLNRELKSDLQIKMAWEQDRADIYSEAILQLDKVYPAWDALRDAQNEFYYITTRREALKKLKCVLNGNFDNGNMPDAIPHWLR